VNTNDIIRSFISSELLQGNGESVIGDDDQLIESGIIDSLGVMTMLLFLEEQFSLQIPGEDLVPENFASISSIATLVERQTSKRRK
jgi:acyl carrier protein